MLSIKRVPYPCSYSKNDIVFGLHSDMYFDSIKILPSVTITVLSIPQPASVYIFSWTNPENLQPENIRFIVGPDDASDSIQDLPNYPFAIPISNYRDMLLEKLKEYAPINAWYTFTAESFNAIKIEAIKAIPELILTFTTNQTWLYISAKSVNHYVEPNVRKGYQMTAFVYFEAEYLSGKFEMVANVPCTMDENANSILDIQSILDAEIENSWSAYPVPGDSVVFKSPTQRRYYVQFTESWALVPQTNVIKTDIFDVRWGGVNQDDAFLAEPMYLSAVKNDFLTWWPSGKRVAAIQNDWLSWMNSGTKKIVTPHVSITTNLGVSDSVLPDIELDTWESCTFQTGYTQLDLQSIVPGQTIASWSFQLISDDLPVSPIYTYNLDPTICKRHIILYFNSFGMPETFSTIGEWSEVMEVSSEIARRSKYFNANTLFPKSFIFNSTHQNAFNAITSSLSNLEALRLQPLLNSLISFVYEGKRLIPIIVNTTSAALVDETSFTQRIELKLLKANDSMRSSFYELTPELNPYIDCGIQGVQVQLNDVSIASFGDMDVYLDDVLVDTFAYVPMYVAYLFAPKMITPGNYRFECTLDNFKLVKHYTFKRQQAVGFTQATGINDIYLRSSQTSAKLFIDWDVPTGFQEYAYTNALTPISHNYAAVSGQKTVTIEKACLNDILQFNLSGFSLASIDFSAMSNLEKLFMSGAAVGNVYLSQLTKLKNITIANSPMEYLTIGFQKDLTILSLSNTAITTENLDMLMVELWNFRMLYSVTPSVYLQTLGFTPSSTVYSIINGTGIYNGQGLVTDFGWTILIF
jgi:hypothetical protein